MQKRTLTTALVALVSLTAAVASGPTAAAQKELERAPVRTLNSTTLTNGSGDRSLTVVVDGYGSFGSSTPAGNAVYDPIGGIVASGTVYESGVYFSPLNNFLTTDGFGAALPEVPITAETPTRVKSTFDVAGFRFALTQELLLTGNGSTLIQTYQITNLGTSTRSFVTVRHVDGDLQFDGSIDDFATVSADGRSLAEFDAGDNPASASTFVGITADGGTPSGFSVQPFEFISDIRGAGGIPPAFLNQLVGDSNGDRITDSGYDVTLSLENRFELAAGATTTYTTTTKFGDLTLAPTATLIWDPPDPNSTDPLPAPRFLRAVPIDDGRPPSAAPPAEVRVPTGGVPIRGYNIYSSTTTPVQPSANNLFGTVGPNQTTQPVQTATGGTFFVVVAVYDTGNSNPSNEAGAGVPGATLQTVQLTPKKLIFTGTGFTSTVQVFLDGRPFAKAAKVKPNRTKVNQKATLATGEKVADYLAAHGGMGVFTVRNSDGGVATYRHPPQ